MRQLSMTHEQWTRLERMGMRRATALLAAFIAFPWSASMARPGAASDTIPKGTAVYVLVPDSSDNIPTAIDHVVSHMNFIVRGIARGRLTKINPTPHQVRVDLETDTVSVAFDARAIPWSHR